MLYATKTGVAPWAPAACTVDCTAERTSDVQPPIHCATGCEAMYRRSAASFGRDDCHASACCFAAELGVTNRREPVSAARNSRTGLPDATLLQAERPSATGSALQTNLFRLNCICTSRWLPSNRRRMARLAARRITLWNLVSRGPLGNLSHCTTTR